MSDLQESGRQVKGLPPRKSSAQAGAEPALGRLMRKNRETIDLPGKPAEAGTVTVTVVIPQALRNRARAAFKATSYVEEDRTWSDFVGKALEAEVARREKAHNGGNAFGGGNEKLSPGRKIQD